MLKVLADAAADEGIWQGYDGEWRYVSRLLISLAEAIPADKYGWRPGPGVRSVSEVIMHIAQSNYILLSITGPKIPPELEGSDIEKKIVSKPEVVAYLRRSLEAVKTARAQLEAWRSKPQGKRLWQDRRCRRDVLADHLPRQRTHGSTDRLRPRERHRATLVSRCHTPEVTRWTARSERRRGAHPRLRRSNPVASVYRKRFALILLDKLVPRPGIVKSGLG